jgi:ubiquinone/menaquinone biosynthesis C-methylase UbiE
VGTNEQYDAIGKEYISYTKKLGGIKLQRCKEFILNNIDMKGKIVLDLGCGYGADMKSFASTGAKELYGVDSSELMIEEAKKTIACSDKLSVANISSLPFPNDMFDVTIAKHSLHYLSDLTPSYREIWRVLKTGGKFIFTVPHPLSEIFLKKSKSYSKKENINFNAYQKFTLTFPSHTLADYLSDIFFGLFEIEKVWELTKQEEWIKDIEAPVVLGILAKKK